MINSTYVCHQKRQIHSHHVRAIHNNSIYHLYSFLLQYFSSYIQALTIFY